jgi:hypothetical protein
VLGAVRPGTSGSSWSRAHVGVECAADDPDALAAGDQETFLRAETGGGCRQARRDVLAQALTAAALATDGVGECSDVVTAAVPAAVDEERGGAGYPAEVRGVNVLSDRGGPGVFSEVVAESLAVEPEVAGVARRW